MRLPRLFVPLGLVLLAGSCVGTESPLDSARLDVLLDVPVQPALIPSAADAGALPINLIRARATRVADNLVLGETTIDVDSTAASWTIDLAATIPADGADVFVYVFLIHAAGETESVEFSGYAGPINVMPGEPVDAPDIPIVRGPIENSFVTGIEISAAPETLLEGRTFTLGATTESSAEEAPTVFWTVLDTEVLSVEGDLLTGLVPGTGRVVATAGPASDTTSVIVLPAPATVVVDPDSIVVPVGETATFTAEVFDVRGDLLPDATVTWSSGTPVTIRSDGDGTFAALAAGTGVVQASAVEDPAVIGTAAMVVPALPIDLGITKTATDPTGLIGDTLAFEIVVSNLGTTPLAGVIVSDSLPSVLTLTSAVPAGTLDAATSQWTWTLETIPPDGADTITVLAEIDAGSADGVYQNIARVATPDGFVDPNGQNDRAAATMTVTSSAPDLAVTASVDDATPAEGDTIHIDAVVTNLQGAGATPVTGVVVEAFSDVELTVVTATPTLGSYDLLTDEWTVGNLAVGQSATLGLDLEIPAGTAGQQILTAAFVQAVDQLQATEANDTATVLLDVQTRNVDVEVLKTIDNPQPLGDSTVVFTVSVVNNGRGDATDIAVFDTLEATFLAPAHTVSTGTLTGDSLWTIPLLAEGDTATWTTSTTVAPDAAGGTASNTAILRSVVQNDTTPANDAATVNVNFPLSAVPVVTITVPSADTVIDPGELITFAATATDAEDGSLTDAIEWRSSVDGVLGTGAGFETDQLSTGLHTISASATDVDNGTGADTVMVTVALISVPTTLNVPFAGTASLPITLTEPAPAGGVTVDIVSATPSIAAPTTATVSIPAGALAANATLSGVGPGVTTVTISNPQYGGASTEVSVTAALNIVQGTLSVPETFPQTMTVQLESAGVPISAPVGGLDVTITSDDPTCVSTNGSVTVPVGLVNDTTTLSYGGSATLTCQTWVHATAPALTSDSVRVTVTAIPSFSLGWGSIAAGHQNGSFITYLGTTLHGGTTVRIESGDPGAMLVAPNATTAGSAFLDLPVLPGQNTVRYYLQGVEGTPDSTEVSLSASATGFEPASAMVSVLTPGLQISGLNTTSLTTFSPDDAFTVGVGVPNIQRTSVSYQAVRYGADTLVATVAVADTLVGMLVAGSDTTDTATVRIAALQSTTGGVAFSPRGQGATDVAATIPGYVETSAATLNVPVEAPETTINPTTVGAGLQYGGFYGYLGATAHGGVLVRIESLDPEFALVSPDASTPGSTFIEATVADGGSRLLYYVQGLQNTVDPHARFVISAPGFVPDTATITVVQPGYDISALNMTSLTTLSPEDPFTVRVGVPNVAGGYLQTLQAVRAGGDTLFATITSDSVLTGRLVTALDTAASVTVPIPPQSNSSPTTVAAGGVAFEPLLPDTVTVTATIDGLLRMTAATASVPITAPTLTAGSDRVQLGSGLQNGIYRATLGATGHGGVTVRIESLDPGVVLIAPDGATPGEAVLDVDVADGSNRANYWLQALDDVIDTVRVAVSAPGFVPDTASIYVLQPGIQIINLSGTQNTFSLDDPFQVRVGVPNAGHSYINYVQARRAGGDTLRATVTSDTPAVGVLTTPASTSGSVDVRIAPSQSTSPTSVASGGVAFDALTPGTTTVHATLPGFVDSLTSSSAAVTVSAPTMSVLTQDVGVGLQTTRLYVTLGASAHGGVTVTIRSSNAAIMRVAANDSTPGTEFIEVEVPDGETRAYYWAQGWTGGTGTVTVSATADGFTDGSGTLSVLTPAVEIRGLASSLTAGNAPDDFYARIGTPNSTSSSVGRVQGIRPGASPVDITFATSAPTIGQLVTTDGPQTPRVLTLVEGQLQTPTTVANGGISLDPLAAGSTVVDVSATGFTTMVNGRITVTINP